MADIQAKKREIFGKKVKTLRKEGLVPAELYGNKLDNMHLSVAAKEFSKVYKEAGESSVVNLVLDNKKIPVLIYDMSANSITGEISNIDFYAVNMDEKIRTSVPLVFSGDSLAVKDGGILVKSMQELEIEALPADLPQHINVDLSALAEIHNSIHIKDLKIGDKVKVFVDPEAVVATVIEMAKEEEVVKPVSVEEVKVEGEEKKKAAEAAKAVEAKK